MDINAMVRELGSITAVADKLGVARSTVRRRMQDGEVVEEPETPKAGRSLDEFRSQHDKDFIVPQRIREGLKALGSGWDYEVQFAKIAGVSLLDLAAYRDAFADHVVQVKRDGKRAWAGTKATAEKMRSMVR